ncbi:MAG: hypothetical protein J0L52_02075 [Caulobacterales bacterium]|nr:hypothetical protein [Caulobacterales bacterium]
MRAWGWVLLVLAGCTSAEPTAAAGGQQVPATTRPDTDYHVWNTGCAAEDGHYALDVDPGYTAGFQRAPAGYESARTHLFWVHSAQTDRTYWYGFSISNGSGGAFALPQRGPDDTANPMDGPEAVVDAGISFYPMGFDGAVGYEPPQGEGDSAQAPPLILIPELGALLELFPYVEDRSVRETAPRALFRLVQCGDAPVAWATGALPG